MKNLFKVFTLSISIVIIFSVIPFSSCDNNDKNEKKPPINIEKKTGTLAIVNGSTMNIDQLKIVSFYSSSTIAANGEFTVDAPMAMKHQLLFIQDKTSKKPVYIAIYDPIQNQVTANDTSTILALTLMNPYLLYCTYEQKNEYINAIKTNQKFSQLLTIFRTIHQTNALHSLDYDKNPQLFQTVVQLTKETMQNLGKRNKVSITNSSHEPPTIHDADGSKIEFVNPRHVFYAAGIYPNAGNTMSHIVTIDRQEEIVSFTWGWPPLIINQPKITEYNLGNGYFKIHITKGFDFLKISQLNDPKGRATLFNTGQALVYLIELLIGHVPLPDISGLPNHFHISLNDASELSWAISRKDAENFIMKFLEIMADNSEELAYWIWQEFSSNAAHEFISSAATIVSKFALVLEILGYANEEGPFLWDMIFAQSDIIYFIRQENGVITTNQTNAPPTANFTVNPPAGIIGTVFSFNASLSHDDYDSINDSINNLQFKWDWESDGIDDTGWLSQTTVTHSYSAKSAYKVTLKVKDSQGLIDTKSHTLNVGGGSGSATHVKLFRDVIPWYRDTPPYNIDATVSVLNNLGFTPGTGNHTYEIIASNQMSSVILFPGEDLVIISNDQNQTFYDNYSQNQLKFANFVYNGGAILWEACDLGWAQGSMSSAGIILPGNITTTATFSYWNYIANQNLPLVQGLPTSMDHNYASHESFNNLPDGTTVYCVNPANEPTLIEFNLGQGWVIATGQPLEHQYKIIYGNPDMELLLPRIVSYFTNTAITNVNIFKQAIHSKENVPSHR